MTIRIALATLLVSLAPAFSQPRDSHFSFDAASLKPSNLGNSNRVRDGGPGTANPGRFRDSNISLQNLLMLAYGVVRSQVTGPQWIESSKYAISVTMPRNTTVEQFRLMLQNLLAERFALEIHHQMQDLPVLTLEAIPGGARVKEAWVKEAQNPDHRPNAASGRRTSHASFPNGLAPDEKGFPILPAQYTFGYLWTQTPQWLVRVTCRDCTMAEFVDNLKTPLLARMWYSHESADSDPAPLVVDRTGLTGKQNFNLEFVQVVALPIIKDPSAGPPFDEAIEKQLGIRLVRGQKARVDALVVDHAEKTPTAN